MRIERKNCGWPECQHDDERCYYGIGAPCETPVLETAVVRSSARIAAAIVFTVSVAFLGAVIAGAVS